MKCRSVMLLNAIVSVMLFSSIASCGTGGPGEVAYQIEPVTAALPYVEAVRFPAEIHAGQPFTIELQISCDQNPLALRNVAHPFTEADHWTGSDSSGMYVVIKPFRDLNQANNNIPVRSNIVYNIDAMPAGIHSLEYISAPDRALGGMSVRINKLSAIEMEDLHNLYKTEDFTVIP